MKIRGNRVVVLAGAIAVLALVPSLARASIIFDHDGDIYAMNDNGTGAHALVHWFGFPGPGTWTIGDPDVLPGGNTVVFTGTTNAYNDGNSGPPGGCGLNCSGTYKLQNGQLTRLSPNAAACGAAQQWCTSFETEPRLTADGNVVFDDFIATWTYNPSPPFYGWTFAASSHSIDTRTAASGSGFTAWATSTANNDSLATDTLPTPDPADSSLIAYSEETNCSSGCEWDVHVGNRAGSSDTAVVYDDAPFVSLAWVPDGSAIFDVEAGQQPGIWVYDDTTATNASKRYIYLLADPQAYDAGHPYSTSIHQARYMGPDKILFDSNGDLYTIPLTACAQKWNAATPDTPGCTIADATRLTTSGKDGAAVWTTASFALPPPPPAKHCVVPKLTGLTVAQSQAALARANCALGTQHRAYSKHVRKGRIISQGTPVGRSEAVGSRVNVTVSKGKKPRRHH